ncbi:hypothetical protein P2318_20585 [Myxococcaceae bacterium GXIMD 01537]
MLTFISPIEVVRNMRGFLFAAGFLTFSAVVSCRPSHPLSAEFERAVQAQQPIAADLPEFVKEPGAVARFAREHGREAVPLYESVIERNKHAMEGAGLAQLLAAVTSLAEADSAAALPVLREIAADRAVSISAMQRAFRELEKISRRDAVELAGQRLLSADVYRERVKLVGLLRGLGGSEAIASVQAAAARETDEALRHEMEVVVRVLKRSDVCHLAGKLMVNDVRGKWTCDYRCAGAKRGFMVLQPEECSDTAALPVQ